MECLPKDIRGKQSKHRSARDFGNIITDEKRGECFFELVQDRHDALRASVSVVCQRFDLDLVHR